MGIALASVEELRSIERTAESELPRGTLMTRAGRAAAKRIDADAGDRRLKVAVLCGPGNNGGDGFVVAAELVQRGHEVTCALMGADAPNPPDARNAFDHWRQSGGAILTTLPEGSFDLVVDALLGIGASRPLDGEMLAASDWINAQASPVVALDIPSGLDADRGSWLGGRHGVEADRTVTFLCGKPGLYTGDGIDAAGSVILEPLGCTVPATAVALTTPADFAEILAPRRSNTHKGTYGDLLVLGGAAGMVGAALLAARAALRLGAGRVYVDALAAADLALDPLQPELMFRRHGSLHTMQAIVVGCGLGTDEAAREALRWAWSQSAALVVDADALNVLADGEHANRDAVTVLTPHPLEAARLLGSEASAVQADRLAAARALAQRFAAIVVLKGAGSVVAHPDGRVAINPTGSPALATPGSGDVLAGMIGALLAQGFESWRATLAAVWLHGKAVAGAGDRGIVASELAPLAIAALRELQRRR